MLSHKSVFTKHNERSKSFERNVFKAKNSSGGGVDAANIMLAQLNAQKPIKKKNSVEKPSPSPGITSRKSSLRVAFEIVDNGLYISK